MGWLSLLTFLPLLGALVISAIPGEYIKTIRAWAMFIAVVTFGLSIFIVTRFNATDFHFQMVETVPWIKSLGIQYQMGVDGISLWMAPLTALLAVVAVGFSFYEDRSTKGFMALLLLLETTMLGTFFALDMILFFVFFEAALLPVALMIWLWGDEKRKLAAVRYFVYLFGGSILMLVGMVALAMRTSQATGQLSFSIIDVQAAVAHGNLWTGALAAEPFVFWAFALAFLIKSPAFPFHTWLVDGYTQAPTGAVILGVLVKTGAYGLIRFCLPLFPDVVGHAAPWIMGLAAIGIIYGGIVATIQTDIKKLIAYSSVSHVGFIILGAFSLTFNGVVGAVFGMANHGIATGALFLLVGLLYLRRRSRNVNDFGGLKSQMPTFAALFLISTLAAVGLPGTSAFIGEFFALLGAYTAGFHHLAHMTVWFTVAAVSGIILAAIYMLVLFQRLFYGEVTLPAIKRLKDLKPWEVVLVGVPTLLILFGGLAPNQFTAPMSYSVQATVMMARKPQDHRPVWADGRMRLSPKLDLMTDATKPPTELATANVNLRPNGEVVPVYLHLPTAAKR
jgi:NADH-quinone oxidoreductase subunit M